jgi:hypothetical protein
MEAKDIHIQEMLPIWAAFPAAVNGAMNYEKRQFKALLRE